jgi:hypothetical protein
MKGWTVNTESNNNEQRRDLNYPEACEDEVEETYPEPEEREPEVNPGGLRGADLDEITGGRLWL